MEKIYEYAVFLRAKRDKEGEIVEKSDILVPATAVVADDDMQAQILAARSIPEEHVDKLDRVTVVVRPF